MYAYRIRITNVGHKPLRLLRRHWIITDANGERREVRGDGVVGETPRIAPGADYEYRSMCDFPTAWGTMEGSFAFVDDLDTEYQIEVARFFLVESSENAIV